jgi:hypothetical protein
MLRQPIELVAMLLCALPAEQGIYKPATLLRWHAAAFGSACYVSEVSTFDCFYMEWQAATLKPTWCREGTMIERKRRYGNLVFGRDAIVRAALRAYVELTVAVLARFSFPVSAGAVWEGGLQRGAIYNDDGCGDYEVVAWTETGVVGLAYELGWGPIEQLGLSVDAVTGGPDDVRGALPGLPGELEPALVMAVGMLSVGPEHGQRDAGVGFWLHGDRVAGTLFDDPMACGASRLAAWGLLHNGRLLPLSPSASAHPRPGGIVVDYARPQDAPAHAVMDAVTDRALTGPTEFTPAELETLLYPFPTPPPKRVLEAQRSLQKVGITWPGSPEIPEPPRRTGRSPFLRQP